ncbi:MAG TPA: glucose 1-dehydrogenase [Planctomycetota bacterium]|jgi:NAD(P)-dependent dehydrogenase (short-subunit alcohol dehydrogenase family)
MDLKIKDKVALVTGGGRGLGKTICQLFAAEGCKVAICDLEVSQALAGELTKTYGVKALGVKCDVTNESSIAAMYDQIEKTLGPVDFLVNNAAIAPNGGPMTKIAQKDWSKIFQVNMEGTFLCTREHVRRMLESGRKGKIVSISSQAAFRGSESGKLAYDASKGAIISFTVALAREMAPHGINVNCVAPGLMRTELMAPLIDADPEKFNKRVPLHRLGATEEIGSVAVFLCGAPASYMTGATVDVSGGLAMH